MIHTLVLQVFSFTAIWRCGLFIQHLGWMKRKWKEQRKQAGGQGALFPSDWEYIISFILKNDRSCKKVWRDPIKELPRCSGNMGWEDGSQVLLESVKQYYS